MTGANVALLEGCVLDQFLSSGVCISVCAPVVVYSGGVCLSLRASERGGGGGGVARTPSPLSLFLLVVCLRCLFFLFHAFLWRLHGIM